ncbi:MAG: hypothetical protein DRN07_07105, partial [Thermoplasmata archaeon]
CAFKPYTPDGVEESVKFIENNVLAAKALGASFVCFAEGRLPQGVPEEEGWSRLVEVLKRGAEFAESNGIMLVDEFHPNLTASTPEKAPKLIDEVGSPAFKGCLDFCHAYVITNGDPVSMIKALGDRIGHVHIADASGEPGMHVPLGKGKVDYKACIAAIKEIGYQGEWTLCMHGYSFPEHAAKVCIAALEGLL